MLCAFDLAGGRLGFRNRYLRTDEYRAAQKIYPQAEAPGRMLTNVMSLRDPSVKDNAPEPLLP